jgi:hypothetical protein
MLGVQILSEYDAININIKSHWMTAW